MCPFCRNSPPRIKKKGFFSKKSTRTDRVQRYFCHRCKKSFSTATGRLSYREKKPHINQTLYRLLCSGLSQHRLAIILNIHRITVARKIEKLAAFARRDHRQWIERQSQCLEVHFDELETYEHTKCKPVSVGIAVNGKTREIIAAFTASMPAKGLLAKKALEKYGLRPDNRPRAMRQLMEAVRTTYAVIPVVKTDKKPSYRPLVRRYLPSAKHQTTKGRRGCVVGQGELKAGGFDPIFTLNHTYAMFRDNLKTLSRRTWCTVKKSGRLVDLLDLYIHFHNRFVVLKIKRPRICGDPIM